LNRTNQPSPACARVWALLVVLITLFAPQAASADDAKVAPEPVRVVVTIPPLLWPVRAIEGSGTERLPLEVTSLLAPGQSEHGFELTPAQVQAVRSADVVVMAGNGLEPRVQKLIDQFPEGRRPSVVSFEGWAPAVESSEAHTQDHQHDHAEPHAHGADHDDHAHGAVDPHAWLDPPLMKQYAGRVGAAIREYFERSGLSDERKKELVARIEDRLLEAEHECDRIARAYDDALLGLPESRRVIVTHHNAYAYLCARYRLRVAAVIRPVETADPTPGEVMRAVNAIKEQGAKAVFVEPQFPSGAAKRIAESAGVKLLTLDPLGDGDWPAMMRKNLAALVEGLGG